MNIYIAFNSSEQHIPKIAFISNTGIKSYEDFTINYGKQLLSSDEKYFYNNNRDHILYTNNENKSGTYRPKMRFKLRVQVWSDEKMEIIKMQRGPRIFFLIFSNFHKIKGD